MSYPATITVLVVTGVTTFYAFQRPEIRERWVFDPQAILARREYYRIVTAGLVHADWVHFAFNAFSFFSFAKIIESDYGSNTMMLVYGSSIVGGSLLSLFVHRHHEYRAVGASGGVCGVIFASIFLLPGNSIDVFPIPFHVPAYLYAVLFLIGSFVGHRHQMGNIGHDAHLGGAIVGLLVATAMYPRLIFAAPWMFAGVLALSLLILAVLIFDPLNLLKVRWKHPIAAIGNEPSPCEREEEIRARQAEELDGLLDLVSRNGIKNLSRSQRKRLEQLSKKLYGENRK